MNKIFIGTSGFLYSHWIGNFYPKNLKKEEFLSFYAKTFNTVEINSSFYHLPRQKTIENWLSQTPKNFVFSFKLSRFVSHFSKLDPKTPSFKLFFNALEPAKNNTHLILIQLPASFKLNLEKLKNFVKALPKDFLYAFEFRHFSWFCSDVYRIFEKENVAVVLSDSPIIGKSKNLNSKSKGNFKNRLWPYIEVETANFFYIRFHGSKRLFASSYTDEELTFYAQLIKQKIKKGMKVFCYFNNDAEGFATKNALKLKNLFT